MVRLHEVSVVGSGTSVRMTAHVERERTGERIQPYVEYGMDADYAGPAADAFAAATLLPSMRAGERLSIVPAISPRLCAMLPRLRDLFCSWWPHLARIDIDVTPDEGRPSSRLKRAATFLSGGVDSFYSLLKHHGRHGGLPVPLTHAIFMRGVETRLESIRGVESTETWVREIAARTCGSAIIGETNFRTVLQGPRDNLHWEHHYHGSALAAIALGVAGGISFVCVPGAYSYRHLIPHGSSPLSDEWYSTEHLQVLHDGPESTRPEKVARIIEWDRDLVLAHLRVCIRNRGAAHNCCRCKKCVRTAVPLRVLGVWQDASTFPEKGMEHWERVMEEDHVALTEENLAFAREHGAERDLMAMLERVVRKKRRNEQLKKVLARPPLDRMRPAVSQAMKMWKTRFGSSS
jgi:hypothetical protein